MKHFSLSSTVRSYPALPYEALKNDILGKEYDLSVVFVGDDRAKTLNEEYRKRSYVPNVLSFPLDAKSGEIYIAARKAAAEAKKFGHTKKTHIGYLYIHGLLHLKGYDHGPKMERLEERFMQRYKFA